MMRHLKKAMTAMKKVENANIYQIQQIPRMKKIRPKK